MSDPYDIFVSYAHVDNARMPGDEQGWVSTLIETLEIYLQQKLGRRESYSIWRDPELPGNVPLTPEILETVRASSILLLVLSPGYLASRWCMQELDTFLAEHTVEEGRIFVVEHTLLNPRPASLADLKGFPFWVPDQQQKHVYRTLGTPSTTELRSEYFRQLEDMAIQLVGRIKALRTETEQRVTPAMTAPAATESTGSVATVHVANTLPLPGDARATVYLAPVSDTLQMERADMVRFLTQQNIRTLPVSNRVNLAAFHQEMEVDLQACSHFIQLLDGSTNMGIPLDQHLIAESGNIAVLQWRARGLDLKAVAGRDPQHAELLQGKNVMESDLVDFQQYILQKILPARPVAQMPAPLDKSSDKPLDKDNTIIFVNAGAEDLPLAQEVFTQLTAQGYFCLLPLVPTADMSPTQIREDLEQNLLGCDALLLMYAQSPAAQVRNHLLQSMRMRSRRPPDRPLRTVVCMAAAISQPLNAGGAGLDVHTCAAPFSGRCVEQFLLARGGV